MLHHQNESERELSSKRLTSATSAGFQAWGGLAPSLKSGLVSPIYIKLKRSFTVSMQILGRLLRKLKPWWCSWTWGRPLAWISKRGGRGSGAEPPENFDKNECFIEAFSSNLEAEPLRGSGG